LFKENIKGVFNGRNIEIMQDHCSLNPTQAKHNTTTTNRPYAQPVSAAYVKTINGIVQVLVPF